jgi:hypothetical protein
MSDKWDELIGKVSHYSTAPLWHDDMVKARAALRSEIAKLEQERDELSMTQRVLSAQDVITAGKIAQLTADLKAANEDASALNVAVKLFVNFSNAPTSILEALESHRARIAKDGNNG